MPRLLLLHGLHMIDQDGAGLPCTCTWSSKRHPSSPIDELVKPKKLEPMQGRSLFRQIDA